MPIGNQEIWDKGIGAGATNVIFGGGDTQPSATNFNPGALGADPNAQPVSPESPATPETPATPATPTTPAQPQGPQANPNQKKIHDLNRRLIQMQAKLAEVNSIQPGGSTAQSYQRQITQLQYQIQLLSYNNGM